MSTPSDQLYQRHVTETLFAIKNAPFDADAELPIMESGREIGSLTPLDSQSIQDPDQIQDLASFREIANPFFPSQFKVTIEGTRTWCDEGLYQLEDRILFWVCDAEGLRIGHVGLFRFDFAGRSCEVDNIVRGRDGGPKGMMTLALKTLMQWAFLQFHMTSISLRVLAGNEQAIRMYKSLGFEEVMRTPLVRKQHGDTISWEETPSVNATEAERSLLTMKVLRNSFAKIHDHA